MAEKQTMTDVAYTFLSKRKKEVTFLALWEAVCEAIAIPEDKQRKKKSQFYSELMLDTRFASLDNNKWDLRNRRKFDEVHVDTSDIELDDDDEEDVDTTDQDNSLDITDQDNENNQY